MQPMPIARPVRILPLLTLATVLVAALAAAQAPTDSMPPGGLPDSRVVTGQIMTWAEVGPGGEPLLESKLYIVPGALRLELRKAEEDMPFLTLVYRQDSTVMQVYDRAGQRLVATTAADMSRLESRAGGPGPAPAPPVLTGTAETANVGERPCRFFTEDAGRRLCLASRKAVGLSKSEAAMLTDFARLFDRLMRFAKNGGERLPFGFDEGVAVGVQDPATGGRTELTKVSRRGLPGTQFVLAPLPAR